MFIITKYDDTLDHIRQFIICLYRIVIFVSFFYRNFAYRNLLTGDNYTPLTRMNVISVVLKSARDRLYTGDTHRQFPKDKTAIKYFCGVGN